MMYGHIEQPRHQAHHLLAIRDLQRRYHGFTEFVPLPFVAGEAPMYLRGRRAARADLPRGRAAARGRAHRAVPGRAEHTGLVGEDGRRGCRGLPARGATTSAAR